MFKLFPFIILIFSVHFHFFGFGQAAPDGEPIRINSIEQAKDLEKKLEKGTIISNCQIRIGDGCGGMGDSEFLECVQCIAKGKPTCLDLSQSYLELATLGSIFQLCPQLQDLDFSHNALEPKDAPQLCQLIQSSSSLHVLNLGYNSLGSNGIKILAKMLQNNTTILKLDLSGNVCWDLRFGMVHDSGDPAAEALAEALKTNRTLMVLKLKSNRITAAKGIWYFSDSAISLTKENEKRQIDVSDNPLEENSNGNSNRSALGSDSALKVVSDLNPELILIFETDQN